jgi:DNA-binding PadR family transcriptional regulator
LNNKNQFDKKYEIRDRFMHYTYFFPHLRSDHPTPPYRGPPSFFGHHSSHRPPYSFGGYPPPRASMPISRESFKELKHFFILMILVDKPEGITGYQLQEKYGFPRGSMLRSLEKLEAKKYVSTQVSTNKGREHKFYIITEEGKSYLENIKEKWTHHFALMSDMAPPEKYGNPFRRDHLRRDLMRKIEKFKSKEDAIDFFRGMRSHFKDSLSRLERRKERIQSTRSSIDEIVNKLEKMESFEIEEIKKIVKSIQ